MKPIWKIFSVYVLTILFILLCNNACGQVKVKYFNADWNEKNDVEWIDSLKDCKVSSVCITSNPKEQKKSEIVVVPTIVIYNKGKEVKRYQADISFTIKATRKEVQDYINELIMNKF